MKKYKLTIAYDGTHYSGWQIQPNAQSIQEIIRKSVETLIRQSTRLIGSGRTDAGVHACGQVAHFHCDQELDIGKFLKSMNGMLPKDIRILDAQLATFDFHAQYSAIGKIYHYHLWLDPVVSPTKRMYTCHVQKKLNQSLLQEAACAFIGKKDFTSFANSASEGSASRGAIRTLKRLDVVSQEGGVRLEFEADGFLYKMVRNIVGTILEVATHQRPLESIPLLFEIKDRKSAGKAAPPQGLFLMQVLYTPESNKIHRIVSNTAKRE